MNLTLFFLSLLLVIVGYFTGKYPLFFWELFESWKYEYGARPKEWYLKCQQAISAIGMGIGILMLILSFFVD